MKYLSRQFKQILLISCLLFCSAMVFAQGKAPKESRESKNFSKILNRANINFTMPDGFNELVAKDENQYDYGISTGSEFEIWFKIIPQLEGAADSAYIQIGKTQAKALAGEGNFLMRNIPDRVLTDYNADAGKTYFISLPDITDKNRFKYALLITLQKNHKGTIVAVCLTNDKGPDFFKNISKAQTCIKFRP